MTNTITNTLIGAIAYATMAGTTLGYTNYSQNNYSNTPQNAIEQTVNFSNGANNTTNLENIASTNTTNIPPVTNKDPNGWQCLLAMVGLGVVGVLSILDSCKSSPNTAMEVPPIINSWKKETKAIDKIPQK